MAYYIMTVDFMRVVDKWIGIPICLLLSLLNRLISPFTKGRRTKPIKKILFLQISEMGSTISAYSALVKAKQLFPDAELYYFIFKEMQESVHLLNIIPAENVFTITSESLPIFVRNIIKMIWIIRRRKIDAILDLELFSRLSSILSYLFGSRIRAGFNKFHMEGLYRGTHHTHKVIYNHMRHISHNFLSLVYSINEDPEDIPLSKIKIDEKDICVPKIVSTVKEKKLILQKLQDINPEINPKKKIVILNPNASELLPLRRWPMESYIKLAENLLRDPSVFIVVTGVKSEVKDAEMICNSVKDRRCINLAGQTTLRELIDLYNISDLLVSNDSGPPNFASLTNIKGLVFFGPETDLCYKPIGKNIEAISSNIMCSPCVSAYNHRKSACRNNRCLQAITVDEVYKRIKKLIHLKQPGKK